MPAGDVWNNTWLSSWDSTWKMAVANVTPKCIELSAVTTYYGASLTTPSNYYNATLELDECDE